MEDKSIRQRAYELKRRMIQEVGHSRETPILLMDPDTYDALLLEVEEGKLTQTGMFRDFHVEVVAAQERIDLPASVEVPAAMTCAPNRMKILSIKTRNQYGRVIYIDDPETDERFREGQS